MKNTVKKLASLLATGTVAALAGCSANPVNYAVGQAINMGQGIPDDMVNRHIAGVVAFDEKWVGGYDRVPRNMLWSQGVKEATPEYNYRVVRINLHDTGSLLWVSKGQHLWPTGAIVPDHLPQLHAGDTVEIRETGSYMTMKDFAATGEGAIVVRILCARAAPDYLSCVEKGPHTGVFKGVGATNTPYPASVRDYGFTFTPMFDAQGRALRPYPQPVTSER